MLIVFSNLFSSAAKRLTNKFSSTFPIYFHTRNDLLQIIQFCTVQNRTCLSIPDQIFKPDFLENYAVNKKIVSYSFFLFFHEKPRGTRFYALLCAFNYPDVYVITLVRQETHSLQPQFDPNDFRRSNGIFLPLTVP